MENPCLLLIPFAINLLKSYIDFLVKHTFGFHDSDFPVTKQCIKGILEKITLIGLAFLGVLRIQCMLELGL